MPRSTDHPSHLLDSSLRQAPGGVTVGRRSAAEIARRGARLPPALGGVGRKHMAWPRRSTSKLLAITLSPNHVFKAPSTPATA